MSLTGWTETTVGQTSEFLTGFPFASSDFAETGIRLIRGSNVKRGVIDWSSDIARYWPNQDSSLRAFVLRDGDIVIAMDGALVGRSFARITKAELPAYLVQRVARLRGKAIDQDLLYQWIGSQDFVKHVDDVKTHTAIPHISPRDIRDFKISIPTDSNEQRAVSAILRDADDLIATLERLIAKKQAIKQGMMQQLLTGRTRLPGYTEDWPSVTLGESGVVAGGGVDKTSNPSEESVLLLNYMDVYRMEFIDHQSVTQVVTAPSPKIAKCSIRAGDVFFTPTSETPDDIARSAVADDDLPGAVYSYHLVRWRPGPGWDRSYLAYAFSTEAFRSQASTLAAGSGTRYVVSMPDFRSLVVPRPPVDEQHAIGEALRDVSSEINVLFRRLAKARAMKTGMMQQLLTGRVRLPVEASA